MSNNLFKEINTNIIALEGPSGAGKTTLLQKIGRGQKEQIGIILEGSEYVRRDTNVLTFDLSTIEGAKESLFFCLEVEKERTKDVLLMARQNKPVLMDRSLLSILIFYNTLATIEPTFSKYFGEFYPYALAVLGVAVKKKNVILPSKIVYMTFKNKQVFRSRQGRKLHNKFLGEWESALLYDKFYKKLVLNHYSKDDVLMILANNNKNDYKKIVLRVNEFAAINKKKTVEINNIFQQNYKQSKYSAIDMNNDNKKYKKIREFAVSLMRKSKYND